MKVTGASGVGKIFALAFVSIALWHQRALGQPGSGEELPGDDDAGGSIGEPPSSDDDGTSVYCAENGTTAHYEEIIRYCTVLYCTVLYCSRRVTQRKERERN